MKRSIVVLLVLLALIILVSPGIVGWLAEKNLEQDIEWAGSDASDVVVTTEKFDRGWFTSAGRHRVSLRPGSLGAKLEPGEAMPSLIIDTRFDHGLVPVSSMSLPSGSLKPGLARMVSTLQIDDGNGKLTDVPGTIYSETSLGGETTGRYVLEAGSRDDADGTASWSGADLFFVANSTNRALSLKGEVLPWSYRAGANTAEVGRLSIDVQQSDSDFGFAVGDLALEIESLAVDGLAGPVGAFKGLTINGSSAVDGEQLNARTQMALQGMLIPGFGDVGVNFDAAVGNLDAASVGRIAGAMNQARASADPDAALGELFGVIQPDLESLLAAGGEFRFDRLDIALPQGEIRSKMSFAVAKSTDSFSWPGVILATRALADIELPAALVEMGRQMSPEAGAIVEMGLLQLDGDVYRMQAAFAGGLLTVNGVPMPVPLPGR